MTIWSLVGLIAGLGALGGLTNCLISNEFVLPQYDKANKVWRPGWIGNVIGGAVAAVVIGGMYGPLAKFVVTRVEQALPALTFQELIGAIVVGLGGGNILTNLSRRQAEQLAKANLADTLAAMTNPASDAHPMTPSTTPEGPQV